MRSLSKRNLNDHQVDIFVRIVHKAMLSIGWVQDHVDEGRSELNFSEWDRNQEEAHESAEEVLEGEMPPSYYKPWSRMSQTELDTLVAGLEATLGTAKSNDHRDDDDD